MTEEANHSREAKTGKIQSSSQAIFKARREWRQTTKQRQHQPPTVGMDV